MTTEASLREATWPRRPLKYVAGVNLASLGNRTPPDYEILYVDISSVGRGHLISQPEPMTFGSAPARARRCVNAGDTVISTVRTYLRAVAFFADPSDNLVASTGFAVLSPGPGVVPKFLYYAVMADAFIEPVVKKSVGVGYPAIREHVLASIPVPTPPLRIQHEVVALLDAETSRINAIIEKDWHLIRAATTRYQTVAEATTRNTEGPSIPVRFLFREIDERLRQETTDLPLLSVSISQGVYRRRTDNHGQVASEDLSNYKICRKGDLVLNRMRAFQGGVGAAPEDGVVSGDYAVLRPIKGHSWYYHHVMRSPWFVGEMTRLLRGIGDPDASSVRTPRINVADLGRIAMPVPPLEDQIAVAKRLDLEQEQLSRLETSVRCQIDLLELRRFALISSVVSGVTDPKDHE